MNSRERDTVRQILNCIQVSIAIQEHRSSYNPFVGLEILMTTKMFEMITAFNAQLVQLQEGQPQKLFGCPVHTVRGDGLQFWIAVDRVSFREEQEDLQRPIVQSFEPKEERYDP